MDSWSDMVYIVCNNFRSSMGSKRRDRGHDSWDSFFVFSNNRSYFIHNILSMLCSLLSIKQVTFNFNLFKFLMMRCVCLVWEVKDVVHGFRVVKK